MGLISKLGYIGIFTIIGLEYACFPIPSEVVLPFVGISIAQTQLQFLPAFLISILAGLSGSMICYSIGFYGGYPLFNTLSRKSSHFEKACATLTKWFTAYGHWTVLFSRMVPLTRTYISFFAGITKMSFPNFILYSSTGIAAWNLMLMSLGLYVGNNWTAIEHFFNTYSYISLFLFALLGLILFIKKSISFHQ